MNSVLLHPDHQLYSDLIFYAALSVSPQALEDLLKDLPLELPTSQVFVVIDSAIRQLKLNGAWGVAQEVEILKSRLYVSASPEWPAVKLP